MALLPSENNRADNRTSKLLIISSRFFPEHWITIHTILYGIFIKEKTIMYWSKYSGIYLMVMGVIHSFVGFTMGWYVLEGMHQAGWWNTIESPEGINFERSAILWFLLFGFFGMLLGYLMHQWLRVHQQRLPSVLGYGFIAMGIMIAIVVPVSGAWMFIPLGLVIIIDDIRSPPPEAVL